MDENSQASAARKLPQTAANFFVGTNSRVPRMTLAQSSHIIPMPMSATSTGFPTSKAVLSRLRPTPNTPTTSKPPSSPRKLAREGSKVAKAVQHFSRSAEEEQVGIVDPSIPSKESEIELIPIRTKLPSQDDGVPASVTSSAVPERKAPAPTVSDESQPAELELLSATSTADSQTKPPGQAKAQDSTTDSSLQQCTEERPSLAPTQNSVLFSAGSRSTPPARSSPSKITSESAAVPSAQHLPTSPDSVQSQVKDHDHSPQSTNAPALETSNASFANAKAASLLVISSSQQEPKTPTVQVEERNMPPQLADPATPSSPHPSPVAGSKDTALNSSTPMQIFPLSTGSLTIESTHATQPCISRSESALPSMPLTLSTFPTAGPVSALQSAFSDSTDPTSSSSPLDKLPTSAAIQTSHPMSKMVEKDGQSIELPNLLSVSQPVGSDPIAAAAAAAEIEADSLTQPPASLEDVPAKVTVPDPSGSPSREAFGPSSQNETVSDKDSEPGSFQGADEPEVLATAELVERLEADAESDASWEDGLLEGVYADSEVSVRRDISGLPRDGMGAASRYHGQAFVSLDAGQEQQDLQQRTYTGQPKEALYADSTGDEEILAELIDDVEGPEAEVEHVKPRDSLIERTTLWIRNTVEEQGSVTIQGADLDRDDDTRSVASIRLIDLAAQAQEPLLEVSTPLHYSDEMASLPRSQEPDDAVRSSPARQAATASDMPELKDSTVTKAGKLTDAFEHLPSAQISNERPVLGQKLTRSFSQRKRLEQTSSKPIKIPGRLKIPQREQEAAAPKVHRESLDLLPALNKPQLPAAEDQPHHNVDARRGSDFNDILLAWPQPGQTVPEPVTPPARGHVGRKAKDWDDSDEEEVASVGVAKRMTLKRMSGFTVHGSPRREPRILPGKLRQKNRAVEAGTGEERRTKRMLLEHLSYTSAQRIEETLLPGKLARRAVEDAQAKEPLVKRVPLKIVQNFIAPPSPKRQSRTLPRKLQQHSTEHVSPEKPRLLPGKLVHRHLETESDTENEPRSKPGRLPPVDVKPSSPQKPTRPSPEKLSRPVIESALEIAEQERSSPGRLLRSAAESLSESEEEQRAKPGKLSLRVVEMTAPQKLRSLPGKLSRRVVESESESEKELKATPAKLPRPALESESASKQNARPLPGKLSRPTVEAESGSKEEERASPGKLSPWIVASEERSLSAKVQRRAVEEASPDKPRMIPGRLMRGSVEPELAAHTEPRSLPGKLPRYAVDEASSEEPRVLPGKLQPRVAGSAAHEEPWSLPGQLFQHAADSALSNEMPRPLPGKLPRHVPQEGPHSSDQRPSPGKLPEYAFEQPSSLERERRPSPGKLAPRAFDSACPDEPRPNVRPLRKLVPAPADVAEPEPKKQMNVRRKRAPTMAAFAHERPHSNVVPRDPSPALPPSHRQIDQSVPQEILQPQSSPVLAPRPRSPLALKAPRTLPTQTPKAESRMLRPLRLASSSSAFSTPRRPDVSVTDTSPRTVTSELWTPNTSNPAQSAVTEETSVSRSMQSRLASAQRRHVTRAAGSRSGTEPEAGCYEHVSGRGRSHTMQRSSEQAMHACGFSRGCRYTSSPDVRLDNRPPPSPGYSVSHYDSGISSGPQHYHRNPGNDRLTPRGRTSTAHAQPSVAPTGAGFDLSFHLTAPKVAPHCSDEGTLVEFGLRVLITPTHSHSHSAQPSSPRRTKVEVRPEQYEYSNLPHEEMSRVQEEAQEFLLHSLVSPAHSDRRGTNESARRGLSSPFVGSDFQVGLGGGRRLEQTTVSSVADGGGGGVSPMRWRARQLNTGLASPLPYIKRAPRTANTPMSAVSTHS